MSKHKLTIQRTITVETDVTVTSDGNISTPEGAVEEVVDFMESHLYCSTCGLLAPDEYEDHGISEFWEEV
jgi:hypothetical protein